MVFNEEYTNIFPVSDLKECLGTSNVKVSQCNLVLQSADFVFQRPECSPDATRRALLRNARVAECMHYIVVIRPKPGQLLTKPFEFL